jgi:hypothetical protein
MSVIVSRTAILRSPIKDLVIYLDGQSNIGRAGTGGAVPIYIIASEAIERCTIWNRTTLAWDSLAYLVNGGVPSTSTTGNNDFGMAHEMGYRLARLFPGKNIRFVMGAFGGAGLGYITDNLSAGMWRPDLNVGTNPHRYGLWLTHRTAALATLSTYVEMGRLWYQGEADSPDGLLGGKQYELNEKALWEASAKDAKRLKTLSFLLNPAMQAPESNNVATVNTGKQNNVTNGFTDAFKSTTGTPLRSDLVHNTIGGTLPLAQWAVDQLIT